ncbi:GntR family transcriptional regulator [Sinosporangium siamense]|uniref:HTH gntR-type domain-containing protein n=1 Tax=Sinosporangium siamense TaxID=1367973 RepID=A0A919VAT7_9ACTN|nr:hypothetical protein Ssi02_59930 [Sinosporangium siamense]
MPPYLRIVNLIRTDISEGRLAPGDLLPSESELMRRHSVCRGTVRRAIAVLCRDGAIHTIHPEGSYVGSRSVPRRRLPRKYDLVAADLRQQIDSGRLPPGDRLPTEAELAKHYRVSQSTVQAAVALLRADHLVFTVLGRGVFVVDCRH